MFDENDLAAPVVRLIPIEKVVIEGDGRRISKVGLQQLKLSIADQGLITPIQLYRLKGPEEKYGISAGRKRFRAVSALGFQTVPATIMDREAAKAWKASENLHRAGKNALGVSQDIVEYAEARKTLKYVVNELPRGGRQPHDRGYKRLAKEIGFDRKRIAEAYSHASLPSSIRKRVLKNSGKLNNRATLNALCRLSSEKEQRAYLKSRTGMSKLTKASKRITPPKRKIDIGADVGCRRLQSAWRKAGLQEVFDEQTEGARKLFLVWLKRS